MGHLIPDGLRPEGRLIEFPNFQSIHMVCSQAQEPGLHGPQGWPSKIARVPIVIA